jgi:rhamnosyltransferase
MEQAQGEHVAFLTQDAQPAHERWLEELLAPFSDQHDIALACGPYLPREHASAATVRELNGWFASLAPDGRPRVDRLEEHERRAPARELFGRRTFFTDANVCVSKAAWRRVPFPPAAYAEDQALALAMLRAGFAKVFVPAAAVLHSHDYPPLAQLRRGFDEWRGLLEVYGWREPLAPRATAARLRRAARGGTLRHELLRTAGALAGSHADRMPAPVRRALSLERRATYQPLADR